MPIKIEHPASTTPTGATSSEVTSAAEIGNARHLPLQNAHTSAPSEQRTTPGISDFHPAIKQRHTTAAPLEMEVDQFVELLRRPRPQRVDAARAALALCRSYRLRGSRGATKLAADLCDDIAVAVPELAAEVELLQKVLFAESLLRDLNADATLAACANLAALKQSLTQAVSTETAALYFAVASGAVSQAIIHFPDLATELVDDTQLLLKQSIGWAEKALSLNPQSSDGYAALARALLIHNTSEANADALELLNAALTIDPDHHGALMGMAVHAQSADNFDEASRICDVLLRMGNASPQVYTLRARLLSRQGEHAKAMFDIERALKLAPEAGLLLIDGVIVAQAANDADMSATYRRRAIQVFGEERVNDFLNKAS